MVAGAWRVCRLRAGRIALFYMTEPIDHCPRQGHPQRMSARDKYSALVVDVTSEATADLKRR